MNVSPPPYLRRMAQGIYRPFGNALSLARQAIAARAFERYLACEDAYVLGREAQRRNLLAMPDHIALSHLLRRHWTQGVEVERVEAAAEAARLNQDEDDTYGSLVHEDWQGTYQDCLADGVIDVDGRVIAWVSASSLG